MNTGRRWEIDALRGLMLVLMTVTHLPTRWAGPLSQPFGFVSAAEGFVLLSAYMVGWVYSRRQRRDGGGVMRHALLLRAWKVYCCQVLLLLFLFIVIAAIGVVWHQPAITDMLHFYLEEPLAAFVSGLLLLYNPPLLDILPMYVLFMIVSPVLLLHGSARGWAVILGSSLMLWFGSQFGLGAVLYGHLLDWANLKVSFEHAGAFSLLAWQLLWVLGLWMGARQSSGEALVAGRFPHWMVIVAVVVALAGLIGRHTVGQIPPDSFPHLALLLDKWGLRPLRLLNLLALVVVTLHFGPRWLAHLRGVPALERLGAASLPVFCTHLVATLAALAIAGSATPERALWVDVAIVVASFSALYLVAWFSAEVGRRVLLKRLAWVERRLTAGQP